MDAIDYGRNCADLYLDVALRNHRQRQGQKQAASNTECADCGEPIPEARRRAAPGCSRCTACQAAIEGGGR